MSFGHAVKRQKTGMGIAKLLYTLRHFRSTAYHYYGTHPSSLLKFVYYSGLASNVFNVYSNELKSQLIHNNLDPDITVVKATLVELDEMRKGRTLPREFYYDKIYNLKTCYVAFCAGELAYIHWVCFKEDYSRFLILRDGVVELNYITTLPRYRGRRLSAKMMAYTSLDLQESSYEKAMVVTHQANIPSIKCIKYAGFRKVATVRTVGPFNRKLIV